MNKQLFSGKTIEEAKDNALDELNLDEEYVIFIEKDEEKKSLFNKKVEIEAIPREDVVNFVKDFLVKIINLMGIEGNVEYKLRENMPHFNIITKSSSILIGKNGKNIDALQAIINQVLHSELGIYYKVQIDISDYKQRKQIRLEKLAKYTAKDVARSKCAVKLEPMNSYERRIIHNALTNSNDVTTESFGEEPNRYVMIKPKED